MFTQRKKVALSSNQIVFLSILPYFPSCVPISLTFTVGVGDILLTPSRRVPFSKMI